MHIESLTRGELLGKLATHAREFGHTTQDKGIAIILACKDSVDPYNLCHIRPRRKLSSCVLGNFDASRLAGWKHGTLIGDFYKNVVAETRAIGLVRFDSEGVWWNAVYLRKILCTMMNKPEFLPGATISYNAVWRMYSERLGRQYTSHGRSLSQSQFAFLVCAIERTTGWKCVDDFTYSGSNLRVRGKRIRALSLMRTVIFKKPEEKCKG